MASKDGDRQGTDAWRAEAALMCKTPISNVTESGLLAAIAVLEEHFGMSSDEFQGRYAAGELDQLFAANHWDHLLDMLATVREVGQEENIVQETRELVGLGGR
jgi:hypothetical protein